MPRLTYYTSLLRLVTVLIASGIDLIVASWRPVAGTGRSGFGGTTYESFVHNFAVETRLNSPWGLALDTNFDRLYVADTLNSVIRSVDLQTGLMEVIAGTDFAGFKGDGFSAVLSELNGPTGLALDTTRRILYVSDTSNNRVRSIQLDPGRVYQAEQNWTLPLADGSINAYVNLHDVDSFATCPHPADPGTPYGTSALFQGSRFCDGSTGTGFAAYQGLISEYIEFQVLATSGPATYELRFRYSDRYDHVHAGGQRRLRLKVNGQTVTNSLVFRPTGKLQAGSRKSFEWARFTTMLPVVPPNRNIVRLELAGSGGPRIDLLYVVPPRLPINTVAGDGSAGPPGCRHGCLNDYPTSRPAVSPLHHPLGLAIDSLAQLLYIADSDNGRVLRLDTQSSMISTVVGGANRSSTRDGAAGAALYGKLFRPAGLALDSTGKYLYVSDAEDHKIRRVDLSDPTETRTIVTLAGFGRLQAPFEHLLRWPLGLALDDSAGRLYVADHEHGRVRYFDLISGSCPMEVVSRLQCGYEAIAQPECVSTIGCCWFPDCLGGFNPDGRGPAHAPEDVLTKLDQKLASPPISFIMHRGSGFCCHPNLRELSTLGTLEGVQGLAWDPRDSSIFASQLTSHRVVKLKVVDSQCAADAAFC